MRSSSGERQFGDKLIPKVQAALAESIISTKRQLFDTEHRLKVMAAKSLADIIGEELGELQLPLVDAVLRESKLPGDIQEIVRSMASGDKQFQAIAGWAIGASGVPGLLSQVMNNEFAPVTRRLLSANPMLDPPWPQIVSMVARGIQPESLAYGQIGGQGISEQWIPNLVMLNQAIPDLGTIYEWLRRAQMSEADARGWLTRGAIPTDLQNLYIGLARTLLSPADAALAQLRGDTTEKYAQEIANAAGLTDDDFAILLLNTGEPPGLEQLLEAYRRTFIDKATLEKGIRQSRVRDEWIPTIEQLRYSPMATADAIEAYIKGYITEDQAKDYTQQNGLEPDDFEALSLSAGEPLSRTEMTMLWNRGLVTRDDVANAIRQSRVKDSYVDWALELQRSPMSTADAIESHVQGYLTEDQAKDIALQNGLREQDIEPLMLTAGEPLSKTEMLTLLRRGEVTVDQVKDALQQSRLKDSYIDLALELRTELPALYEVRALLSAGALTAEQGTTLLLEQGYSADIVKAIVSSLTGGTLAATKELTAAQLSSLYQEREISADEYVKELVALGYSQANAELLETLEDQKWTITARNQVITKIRSQYIGHKITQQQASADLDALQISSAMRDQLFEFWNLELASAVKLLSESQVVDAWQLGLFENGDPAANTQLALGYLANLGYSSGDAMILLELKNKGPLDANTTQSKVSSKQGPSTGTEGAG
jgi:hypothetical protein